MKNCIYILSLVVAAAVVVSCKPKTKQPAATTLTNEKKWWKEAVVYQLYPRSFKGAAWPTRPRHGMP